MATTAFPAVRQLLGAARVARLVVRVPSTSGRLVALRSSEGPRTLRVPVQATYQLAQAPEALAALGGEHTQGKLTIRVS